jgi:hypothetical protein
MIEPFMYNAGVDIILHGAAAPLLHALLRLETQRPLSMHAMCAFAAMSSALYRLHS